MLRSISSRGGSRATTTSAIQSASIAGGINVASLLQHRGTHNSTFQANPKIDLTGVAPSYSRLKVSNVMAKEVGKQAIRHAHTCAQEAVPRITTMTGPPKHEFWRKTPEYADTDEQTFLSYRHTTKNMLQSREKGQNLEDIREFLARNVPERIPLDAGYTEFQSRDDLIQDVLEGIPAMTMMVRITPYMLSRVNWSDPRNDPVFRQFIPVKSALLPDHPKMSIDSLREEHDYVVDGLVHRYQDKALFLATSVCPTYCQGCTRARLVGGDTTRTQKQTTAKAKLTRWEQVMKYIADTPTLCDIVISGGDSYYLAPHHIQSIGEQLIAIPHIRRFRFATKGLCVAPERILDANDGWAPAIINVSNKAKRAGKSMAIHTHFNHPNEISYITEMASQRLLEAGVTVRNQTVLFRGINDDFETMSALIRRLADINIVPYYVYQCDMVDGIEHLRTPLQTILDLEAQVRGSIAGFMTPQFVVDLPGGGGKRLACSHESYDRRTGRSTFRAPAVLGKGGEKKDKVYEYWDPVDTLPPN